MKTYIIAALCLVLFSCKKEPIRQPDEIKQGVWYATTKDLTITVSGNVNEHRNPTGRYITYNSQTFRVESVTYNIMVLKDETGIQRTLYRLDQ